jgi:ubiquitin C-terminal hydrolase
MDFLSHEQGKLGLPNVGNSCYLNSTIQCLAGTPELKDGAALEHG